MVEEPGQWYRNLVSGRETWSVVEKSRNLVNGRETWSVVEEPGSMVKETGQW